MTLEEVLARLREQSSRGSMGLTTGGAICAGTARTLDECVGLVQEIRDAAAVVRDDVLVLCHGGPIAESDDAAYVLGRTRGVNGFFGASSMERLPTETAIRDRLRRFKAIRAANGVWTAQ